MNSLIFSGQLSIALMGTASFFCGRRNEVEIATKKDTVDSRIKLLKSSWLMAFGYLHFA